MGAGLVDQPEQNLALAGEADAPLFQRSLNRVEGHIARGTIQF
jgi:hypothetical protein